MDKSRRDCLPSPDTGGSHLSGRNWCSARQRRMSALTPKADIAGRQLDVRFVPKADIRDFCDNPPRLIFAEQTAEGSGGWASPFLICIKRPHQTPCFIDCSL